MFFGINVVVDVMVIKYNIEKSYILDLVSL